MICSTSKGNNLSPKSVVSHMQTSENQYQLQRQCSGRGCSKNAKNLLAILYINKKGYFCDECARDLLAGKLAISLLKGDLS